MPTREESRTHSEVYSNGLIIRSERGMLVAEFPCKHFEGNAHYNIKHNKIMNKDKVAIICGIVAGAIILAACIWLLVA